MKVQKEGGMEEVNGFWLLIIRFEQLGGRTADPV